MSLGRLVSLAVLLIATAAWSVGCGSTSPPPKANGGQGGHDHGHDHDHAHHGPHGGHILEVLPADWDVGGAGTTKEEYHAEWTHEEDGTIDVYLLDGEMKKSVPISAEKIVIEVKAGENVNTYDLTPIDRTEGDNPTASHFQITSKSLLGGLEALKGLEATLKLDINGKPFVAKIEADEHGHKH